MSVRSCQISATSLYYWFFLRRWRKLVSRLAVHLHLRVPQSSENILKLAQLFPGAVCLAFDPQVTNSNALTNPWSWQEKMNLFKGIFDYGVLNGFRLRKLSLRSLTSPETLCNLPSSISRCKTIITFCFHWAFLIIYSNNFCGIQAAEISEWDLLRSDCGDVLVSFLFAHKAQISLR